MSLKQPNTSSGLIMSRNIIVESEAQEQERKWRKIEAADKKTLLRVNSVEVLEEIREAYLKGEDWKKKSTLQQLTCAYRALGQKGTPKLGEMRSRLTTLLLAANIAVVDNIELDEDAEDESKISECGDEDIQ